MADRSVNININYKVNTADIQKAQAASKAAQQATDNLRKSASVYGATAVKASNDAANSVKKISEATKTATKDTETLGNQFGNLYGAIKTFIAAGLVRELVSTTLEMAKLAGNTEGVDRAFRRTFPNSVKVLSDLRAATKGTVTDFELMQRTLQATNLGVTIEKLPVLFEFAAARAQQTGESVDYLVDSIVRGIGRKSILILDNLGLSATRLKEEFNGASLASQSVGEVTDAVGRIAEIELKKMGGFAETAATKVDQLTVSFDLLKRTIAKKVESGGVIGFFKDFIDGFTDAIKGEKELRKERAESIASEQVDLIIKSKQFKELKENQGAQIALLISEIANRQRLIRIRDREIEQGIAFKKGIEDQYSTEAIRVNKQIVAQRLSKATLEESISIIRKYIKEIQIKAGIENAELDTLDALESKLKDLNEELQNTDEISTKSGVKKARAIKQEITATQDKIDSIKLEIYWEEELQRRRAALRKDKKGETVELRVDNQASRDLAIDINKSVQEAIDNIPPITMQAPVIPLSEWDKLEQAIQDNMGMITQSIENIISEQAAFQLNADVEMYNARIQAAHEFYDTQVELAGDNEKAKSLIRKKEDREIKELTRKRADAEKKAALGGIIVNTALGIIKAIATATSVYDGLVKSLVVAAEGASQYSIASNARYYAKGGIDIKGPGTSTSDSIPANLSRGESVMTAKETFRAKGILEMIRGNKIDDNILKQLQVTSTGVKYVGMSDERIVSAIQKQKYPDLVKVGSDIFEVKKAKDGISKTIRRKSMGNG